MKRYWIQFRWELHKGILINKGHRTGLTLEHLVELIAERGVSRFKRILHDDKLPERNTKAVNGAEMLSIWKRVQKRTILSSAPSP
jgi:hypothetical protein